MTSKAKKMKTDLELLLEYIKLSPMQNPISMALSSYKMTTIGKLFFASLVASMMTGQRSPFKIGGDKRKVDSLVRAVQSSKRFQDEIRRPGATVDSVVRSMDLKHVDAKNFENLFGAPWPI